MSRTALLIVGLAGLLITPLSFLSAAELAGRASFDTVAKVTAITNRDSSGRAQRFMDAGNREFAVKYDAQQRLQAVEATRGPHISDIVSIGYAPDGKLVGVRLRTGYTVFFDNPPNGTQVIRDSRGGALIRTGRVLQPVDSAPSSSQPSSPQRSPRSNR